MNLYTFLDFAFIMLEKIIAKMYVAGAMMFSSSVYAQSNVYFSEYITEDLLLIHKKRGYSVCFDANKNGECEPQNELFLPDPDDGDLYWKLRSKEKILDYVLQHGDNKPYSKATKQFFIDAYHLRREKESISIPVTYSPAILLEKEKSINKSNETWENEAWNYILLGVAAGGVILGLGKRHSKKRKSEIEIPKGADRDYSIDVLK